MGTHFPSGDERWRDTAGADFLRAVAARLGQAGARLVSAHVVAIAEEPRLAPHIDAMAAACAEALDVEGSVLRITATSTDGLGFAGRGEGIGASAVVLARRRRLRRSRAETAWYDRQQRNELR